jgi:hypothetical protein
MKINVVDEFGCHVFNVEVSPTDTIWTLKWEVHRESLRGPSERDIIPPPPDDQTLFLLPHDRELSQCDKTIEFYDIHEASEVSCGLKWSEYPQESNFRKFLDVFRKVERNSLSFEENITWSMTVSVNHACCHMHEVRILDLWSIGAFITPYSLIHIYKVLQHCIIFILRLVCKI